MEEKKKGIEIDGGRVEVTQRCNKVSCTVHGESEFRVEAEKINEPG